MTKETAEQYIKDIESKVATPIDMKGYIDIYNSLLLLSKKTNGGLWQAYCKEFGTNRKNINTYQVAEWVAEYITERRMK